MFDMSVRRSSAAHGERGTGEAGEGAQAQGVSNSLIQRCTSQCKPSKIKAAPHATRLTRPSAKRLITDLGKKKRVRLLLLLLAHLQVTVSAAMLLRRCPRAVVRGAPCHATGAGHPPTWHSFAALSACTKQAAYGTLTAGGLQAVRHSLCRWVKGEGVLN